MKTPCHQWKVYFIAGTQDMRHCLPTLPQSALLNVLEQALQAGIDCFQWRDKGPHGLQSSSAQYELAYQCLMKCRQYGVPMLINDDVDMALALAADGVHIGQGDEPVQQVIARCPAHFLIGLTINTLGQAQQVASMKAIDYFGVGPIYTTMSKADAQAPVGTPLIQAIRQAGIEHPIMAIGGITPQNVAAVYQAGADGVAVISALTQSPCISQTIAQLRGTLSGDK